MKTDQLRFDRVVLLTLTGKLLNSFRIHGASESKYFSEKCIIQKSSFPYSTVHQS